MDSLSELREENVSRTSDDGDEIKNIPRFFEVVLHDKINKFNKLIN